MSEHRKSIAGYKTSDRMIIQGGTETSSRHKIKDYSPLPNKWIDTELLLLLLLFLLKDDSAGTHQRSHENK